MNSDQFFTLESLPNKVAMVGGGYIAVELGGVLHGLGSDTSIFVRGDTALRNFDPMIRNHLDFCMRRSGLLLDDCSYPSKELKCIHDPKLLRSKKRMTKR